MNSRFKIVLWGIMTFAMTCGFLHHFIEPEILNFERLHIFLFNLCSGGTLLIYFTEGHKRLSGNGIIFLLLSVAFAICAFMHWYGPTLFIPLLLATIIERVRVTRFSSRITKALFGAKEPTSRKFHQASLLCLSLSLMLSSPVIFNSEYGHWVTIEKLKLDTFFLGFSFPISLISMSMIFELMHRAKKPIIRYLKAISFWFINLGVIIFFFFILAKWFVPQVIIATILFVTVALILYLYRYHGMRLQQKAFLTSGILFLVVTSITGIIYICLVFSDSYDPQKTLPLLRLHSFTALYGWNLTGLAVIARHSNFPINLHSQKVILTHWLTVFIFCPLGFFYPLFALVAVISYGWLLYMLFFNSERVVSNVVEVEEKVFAAE